MTDRALRAAAAALALVLAAPPLHADQARLLSEDRESAEARVEMVLASEGELLASAFIFGDDPFTLTTLSLLRDTARRGIRVQLLVDAQWNKVPKGVMAHLVAEKIEIREYHRFRFDRLSWIFRRMHDKLLVTDGRELVAGGRNVESPYFGLGRQIGRRNYIDLDLQVRGDVAEAARAYFRTLWGSRHVSAISPKVSGAELAIAAQLLDQHKGWLDAEVERRTSDPERAAAPFREIGPVRFLHDPIGGKDKDEAGVAPELRDLLAEAKESALIESPYLIPSRALRRTLVATVQRGVRLRVLTNSLGTTDNLWAQAGYVGRRRDLVRAGIELWEYKGKRCLHSKAAVIDGRTVIVGSYNLDPFSERLNTETALVAENAELAAELAALFDEHLKEAWRIDQRGWPEGHDEPFPNVKSRKILKLYFMRLFTPLIQGFL